MLTPRVHFFRAIFLRVKPISANEPPQRQPDHQGIILRSTEKLCLLLQAPPAALATIIVGGGGDSSHSTITDSSE
jgi:hypothetical protein